ADVEQAAMEGDGDGEPGEDEIGGVEQGESDVLAAAEGALEQDDGGAERVFADQEHDEAGDDEGDDQVYERDQAVVDPARKFRIRDAHSAAPSWNAGHKRAT